MNKTNYCRVEKSIRYAFSNAVTYGDLALVEKYLSVVNVTNGNLLHTLYARVSEEQREEKKANLPEKDREKQNTYEKEVNTFFIKIMCELMDFRNKCIGEEDHLYESMKETFGKSCRLLKKYEEKICLKRRTNEKSCSRKGTAGKMKWKASI